MLDNDQQTSVSDPGLRDPKRGGARNPIPFVIKIFAVRGLIDGTYNYDVLLNASVCAVERRQVPDGVPQWLPRVCSTPKLLKLL